MAEIFREKRGNGGGRYLNIDKEIASSMLNSSYAVDLKTAVHTSLETIRNMLLERPNNEEISVLTQQVERLLTEQTERLESINRDLEAFNYSVAHDLCAPLRRISGFTRTLQERYAEISADPAQLDLVLAQGRERATAVAAGTLARLKQAMGFLTFP